MSTIDVTGTIRAIVERVFGVYAFRATYLPRGIRLDHDLEQHLPHFKADVVFDVGAHIGQSVGKYLTWFAGAQIFCFEPVEDSFRQLCARVKEHSRVHCQRLALGASGGEGTIIHHGPSDTSMSFLATTVEELSQHSPGDVERVAVQTLDDFCRNAGIGRISYLKIDTEGGDLDVLKGASAMLAEQRIDLVEVEAGMNPGNTRHVPLETLKTYLEAREYFVFALYEQIPEWPERAPHLRRVNSVFASRRVIDANSSKHR